MKGTGRGDGRRRDVRGSALLLAVALAVLAHGVAGAVTAKTMASSRAQQRRWRHAAAFEAAEGALAESVQRLLLGESGRVPERVLGEASGSVDVRQVGALPIVRTLELSATGLCRGATERVVLVVGLTYEPSSGTYRVEKREWRQLPGDDKG